MCHEGWLRRGSEEGEASRRLWDEFEHARPLRDPEVTEEESEVTLETRDRCRCRPTPGSRRR
jgi:hypothetical protein